MCLGLSLTCLLSESNAWAEDSTDASPPRESQEPTEDADATPLDPKAERERAYNLKLTRDLQALEEKFKTLEPLRSPTREDIGDPPPSLKALYSEAVVKQDKSACKSSKGKWFTRNPKLEGCLVGGKRTGRWVLRKEGVVQAILHFKSDQLDGDYWELSPQGSVVAQGHFESGKRTGLFRRWGPGGQLTSVQYYRADQLEGPSFSWFPSTCQPMAFGSYHKNEKHGLWREWHESGALKSEGKYWEGSAEGKWSYHHPEGNKLREGVLINNIEEGEWREWLHTGQSWRSVQFMGGVRQGEDEEACAELGGEWQVDYKERTEMCVQFGFKRVIAHKSYYENGKLMRRAPLDKDGMMSGTELRYHPTGELLMRAELVGGIPQGEITFLDRAGKAMAPSSWINQGSGLWRAYHHNGKLSEEGEWLMGAKVGIWKSYYDHGGLESEVSYQEPPRAPSPQAGSDPEVKQPAPPPRLSGRPQGVAKYFYRDGTIKREGAYDMGARDGVWKFYYQNGQVAYEVGFEQGERSGVWREWHWLSSPKVDGAYKSGKRVGTWREYHNNGVVAATGDYQGGKKSGDWVQNWYSGSFWRRLKYENGRSPDQLEATCTADLSGKWEANLKKRAVGCQVCQVGVGGEVKHLKVDHWRWWHPNGELEREGRFELGKTHGLWRRFNHEGKLVLESRYHRGERVGKWRGFYPEGALQYEGSFGDSGREEGEWVTYRSNGSVESRGVYRGGAREGLWSWWHADGSLAQAGRFVKRAPPKADPSEVQKKKEEKEEEDKKQEEESLSTPQRAERLDARHGLWVTWYPGCKIKTVGHYERGVRVGLWRWWRASGEGWRSEWYERGRRAGRLDLPDALTKTAQDQAHELCVARSPQTPSSAQPPFEFQPPPLGELKARLMQLGLLKADAIPAPSRDGVNAKSVPIAPSSDADAQDAAQP